MSKGLIIHTIKFKLFPYIKIHTNIISKIMTKTTVTISFPDFKKWIKAVNMLTVETGTAVQETAIQNAPRKTGVYLNSINYDGDKTVTANARYSAAIEYGFDNYQENVKEHIRNITQAFGKPLKEPKAVTVKAHTRTMNRKPNPVMRMAARTVQKQIPELWENAQRKAGL
jgi:hypothetical protein